MPQDQSPNRRDHGAADARPTAAQMSDPVAFARRLELARAQRAEALARRNGGASAVPPTAPDQSDGSPGASARGSGLPATAAPSGTAVRRDRVNAAPQTAFARPAATPLPTADQAHRGYAASGAAFARPAPDAIPASARRGGAAPTAAEPFVAPPRRPAPPRSRGASRAAAATLLILGFVVAAAPPLRQRAIDLAAGLLPGGVIAVQLAEPSPPAGPPAPTAEPRLAAPPESPASGANRAPITADWAERPSAGPALPALGLPALRAGAAPPAEPPQPRLGRLAAMDALAVPTPAEFGAGPAGTSPARASDPPTPIPPAAVAIDPAVSGLADGAPVVAGSDATDAAATDAAAPNTAAATQVTRAVEPLDIPRPTAADRAVEPAPSAAEPPTADAAAPTGAAAPQTTVAARGGPAATTPALAPSVAVHAPPSISDAALAATMATLGTARFGEVWSVRVSVTIERTHVRYYHAADAAAARRLAALVAPGGVAEVRDFTHFSPRPAPGRLEAWLSGAAAARRSPPSSRETATQAPPAPAAPLGALPLADPTPKFVIGRQATAARIRPALPLLQQLYSPPVTPAPSARETPTPPRASPAFGGGLY